MNEKTLKVLEFDKIIERLSDFTTSQLGKEKVKLLKPEQEIEIVKNMLKETDDGVKYVLTHGMPSLGGLRDITDSLKRVDIGAVLNPGELLNICDVLRLSRKLKNHAFNNVKIKEDEKENVVLKLIDTLEVNKTIEEKIDASIASENEIKDEASTTLKTIRRHIRDQQESIKDKLNDMVRSSKYSKYMQEPIVTIREGRYVIPVKHEYKNEIPGLVHDFSASGVTVFIEPLTVVEANNNIKQLMAKENNEIQKILAELTKDVAGILNQLRSNIEILANLDYIFAKANFSLQYNCIFPKLNTEGRIVLQKARHPLIDPAIVVPIDFAIGNEVSTVVITGPNTGGKTVALKTIGLLTIMAQAGLHIPAGDDSELCVFNKVFADIGDEQSIQQSLSTFSSHMSNIVNILKHADDKTLVLLDELGAGTDPVEGAALAMAILEHLHEKGSIIAATTHYSELKLYAMTTNYAMNASCEFDVETLKPTYRLIIGIPGKSNAFAISKRLGLPDNILNKAQEFLSQENVRFEDLLSAIEKDRFEAEKERMKARAYELEAENLKEEILRERQKIENEKGKIIKEAKEEAYDILTKAVRESETVIAELRKLKYEEQDGLKNKKIEELKRLLKSEVNKIDEDLTKPLIYFDKDAAFAEDLKPGDSVAIPNLNLKGIVIEPPDNNGETIVQTGIMKITVHVSNLRIVKEPEAIKNEKSGIGEISKAKAMNISTELDLRGLSLEEAVEKADKYIDDASIAGLRTVVLIHGKGTGILRTGIHKYLKTNPHVKSFRLGKFGEGETGVTVVELK